MNFSSHFPDAAKTRCRYFDSFGFTSYRNLENIKEFFGEDTLLANCPEHLRRAVNCAIMAGMRRGEILSLRWYQIRDGFIYLDPTIIRLRPERGGRSRLVMIYRICST
jgi:integrase